MNYRGLLDLGILRKVLSVGFIRGLKIHGFRSTKIKPGSELGFETRQLLVVTQKLDVKGTSGQGIYPLPLDRSLREGDVAYVIPATRYHPTSGGSLTTYSIIPLVGDRS